jgi:hypothetical protein
MTAKILEFELRPRRFSIEWSRVSRQDPPIARAIIR